MVTPTNKLETEVKQFLRLKPDYADLPDIMENMKMRHGSDSVEKEIDRQQRLKHWNKCINAVENKIDTVDCRVVINSRETVHRCDRIDIARGKLKSNCDMQAHNDLKIIEVGKIPESAVFCARCFDLT